MGEESAGSRVLKAAGEKMSAILRKSLQEMVSVYWGDGDGIHPPPTCIQNAMSALATADKDELLQVAKAAIAYIDAIPKDLGSALPAMPGFDRDWAEEVIAEAIEAAK